MKFLQRFWKHLFLQFTIFISVNNQYNILTLEKGRKSNVFYWGSPFSLILFQFLKKPWAMNGRSDRWILVMIFTTAIHIYEAFVKKYANFSTISFYAALAWHFNEKFFLSASWIVFLLEENLLKKCKLYNFTNIRTRKVLIHFSPVYEVFLRKNVCKLHLFIWSSICHQTYTSTY